MAVADHWYSSSANVIAIVGAAVTFLSALIGAWVTYLLTVPRCRLRYALVYAFPANRDEIEDRAYWRGWDDEALPRSFTNPYLLQVQLKSYGSRDIPSAAFDEGKPLILDCGVPLIAQSIVIRYTPQSVPAPKTTVNGNKLEVGPGLINRRHVLSYSILAQGAKNSICLECRSSLTDVAVRRDRKDKKIDLLNTYEAPSRPESSIRLFIKELIGWAGIQLLRFGLYFGLKLLLVASIVIVPALLRFLATIVTNPVALGIIAGAIAIAITVVAVIYVRRQGLSD